MKTRCLMFLGWLKNPHPPSSPQKRRRKSTAAAPVAGLDVSCDVRFRGKKKSEVDRFGIRDAETAVLQFSKWKRDQHF